MTPTLTAEDLERELWLRKRNSGELAWTTKEGKTIPLKEMTDKHIENCLQMMERIDTLNEAAAEFMAEDWGNRS